MTVKHVRHARTHLRHCRMHVLSFRVQCGIWPNNTITRPRSGDPTCHTMLHAREALSAPPRSLPPNRAGHATCHSERSEEFGQTTRSPKLRSGNLTRQCSVLMRACVLFLKPSLLQSRHFGFIDALKSTRYARPCLDLLLARKSHAYVVGSLDLLGSVKVGRRLILYRDVKLPIRVVLVYNA
jgi:hypothetical protein